MIYDWRGPIRRPIRGGVFVHRGAIATRAAEAVGEFVKARNPANITLFFDEKVNLAPHRHGASVFFWPQLKVYIEMKRYGMEDRCRIVVLTEKTTAKNDFVEMICRDKPDDADREPLRFYYKNKLSTIWEKFHVYKNTPDVFQNIHAGGIWIFNTDAGALAALQWTERANIEVPGKLMILSMEGSPGFYPAGISCCGLDWEGLGYLMAHEIIGDFKPLKSEKHYLNPTARILHRETT